MLQDREKGSAFRVGIRPEYIWVNVQDSHKNKAKEAGGGLQGNRKSIKHACLGSMPPSCWLAESTSHDEASQRRGEEDYVFRVCA